MFNGTSPAEALKREIKGWEHAFAEAYGRKPSWAEVKSQPDILRLYEDYRALSRAGEPTGGKATDDGGASAAPGSRGPIRLGARILEEQNREQPRAVLRKSSAILRPSTESPAWYLPAEHGMLFEGGFRDGHSPPSSPPQAAARPQTEAHRRPKAPPDVALARAAAPLETPCAPADILRCPRAQSGVFGGGSGLLRGGGRVQARGPSVLPRLARSDTDLEALLTSPCKPCAPAAPARALLCSAERGCVCAEPGQECGFRWRQQQPASAAEVQREANIAANNEVLRSLGLLPPLPAAAEPASAAAAAAAQGAGAALAAGAMAAGASVARAGSSGARPLSSARVEVAGWPLPADESDEDEEVAYAEAIGAPVRGRGAKRGRVGAAGLGGGGGAAAAPKPAAAAKGGTALPRPTKRARGAKALAAASAPSHVNDNFVKTSLKRSLNARLKRGGSHGRRAERDGRRRKGLVHASAQHQRDGGEDGPGAQPGARSLYADALLITAGAGAAVVAASGAAGAAGAAGAVGGGVGAGGEAAQAEQAPIAEHALFLTRPRGGEAKRAAQPAGSAGASLAGLGIDEALASVFGHGGWRELQREAVERTLGGHSTLLLLPTGGGKSLCYQLPALLCAGLVLVISPLLALIDDQLAKLPAQLPGAKLTSAQTREQAAAVLASLRPDAPPACRPKLLFVSPERLSCPSFAAALRGVHVAFACVDEAHCVSQWAHHFRPAYLQLGRQLRDELGIRTVLALSATATSATAASVLAALRIPADGLLARPPTRPNLQLRAIRVPPSQRLAAMAGLLARGELRACRPAIVYCATRTGAEEAAAALRAAGEKGVEVYHAGIGAPQRERLHARFERGAVPLLVATCAFGMGVDLQSVRAVVHCGLPRSPEHYVQETGRAGRDGLGGVCVALFDEADREWLASRAHSAAVDGGAVCRLLHAVFGTQRRSGALPRPVLLRAAEMCAELDMSEETVETIIALLHGQPPAPAGVSAGGGGGAEGSMLLQRSYALRRADVHATVELRFHEGAPEEVGAAVPLVGFLLRSGKLQRDLSYRCSVGGAAAEFNCALEEVTETLESLRLNRQLTYTLKERAMHLHVVAEPADTAALAHALTAVLRARDSLESARVNVLFAMMCRAAAAGAPPGGLAAELAAYFADECAAAGDGGAPRAAPPPAAPAAGDAPRGVADGGEEALARQWRELQYAHAAVVTFVRAHQHTHKLTAVSVARVLHGISSVGFPAAQWRQSPHWGKHVGAHFDQLVKLASAALAGPAKARKQAREGHAAEASAQ